MSNHDSPFLRVPPAERVAENDLAFAIRDRFPVTPGHTLVIPKRFVTTWFDATLEEQHALLVLVTEVKRTLDAGSPRPDGYNLGKASGQTLMHLHVHVIPATTAT
jgi:diadenosine tetraphosphate (Ap4A) HIT family hydrolase